MTRKLFALYFRLIFSSPVLWAYYFVSAGFFAFMLFAVDFSGGYDNFYSVIYRLAYIEIVLVCFAFFVALVFARKKSTLETACLVPKEKALFVCVLSVTLASWVVCLLPVLFSVAMTVNQHLSAAFCVRVVIFTLLRWTSMLTLMVSIGFVLGRVVKSAFVYLLSAPIAILFSNLNSKILIIFSIEPQTLDRFSTMLSIHHLFVNSPPVDFSAPSLDLLFFVKVLTVMLFAGLLLCALYLISKNKRGLPSYALLTTLIVVFGLSAYSYVQLFPTRYAMEGKLFIQGENDGGYSVTAYGGEIKLSEFSRFRLTVTVEGDGSGKPLRLRLDEAIEPDSISCGGEELSYTREGDYITIEGPPITGGGLELDFEYRGRIYYMSSIGTIDVFASSTGASLPPTFAFLPVIDGDNGTKKYDLTIEAGNTVISNLDVESVGKGLYRLKGESNLICIFAGNFEEVVKNGVTFYRPKDYTTDFDSQYENMKALNYFDLDAMSELDGPCPDTKKVMQLYFWHTGGRPVLFDDCLITHHSAM